MPAPSSMQTNMQDGGDAIRGLGPVDSLSLFIDFDGTLVPLAERPDAIEVPSGLVDLLNQASARLGGRLVLVSGRSIEDLDRHLNGARLAMSGSHGLELRHADGSHELMAPAPDLEALKSAVEERSGAFPGLLIEEKSFGLGLHYRETPEADEEVLALARRIAERFGLMVKRGKMVVEVMPGGFDKGHAVKAIMEMPLFGKSRPVFIGDDLTDEDGFRAAQQLGGLGVVVGDRGASSARARFESQLCVHDWLRALAGGEL